MKTKSKLIEENKKSRKCHLKTTKKGKLKLIIGDKIKTIGDVSILEDNIDSSKKSRSIKCKCKKDKAFLINNRNKKYKYYYCISCSRIYKI